MNLMAKQIIRADSVVDATSAPPVPASGDAGTPTTTRDRILDIALDLFSRKGYTETSLREIAAELGTSKAALYYHFESKQDILLALHRRMHTLIDAVQTPLPGTADATDSWERLIDELIGVLLRNRRLIEMHVRNREAVADLHRGALLERHGPVVRQDLENYFLGLHTDTALPLAQRIRRIAAVATIGGVLLGASAAFADTLDAELEAALRAVIHDVLGDRTR